MFQTKCIKTVSHKIYKNNVKWSENAKLKVRITLYQIKPWTLSLKTRYHKKNHTSL